MEEIISGLLYYIPNKEECEKVTKANFCREGVRAFCGEGLYIVYQLSYEPHTSLVKVTNEQLYRLGRAVANLGGWHRLFIYLHPKV